MTEGAGESTPAMEVTPSQVEMEVVVAPPPAATPSEGLEDGGVMVTQAMPTSPGRHVGGEVSAQPASEGAVIMDYPLTPDEVKPEEWPRRATTPPPPPASEWNGTKATTLTAETMDIIARQVKRVVFEKVEPLNDRLDAIAAVNEARAEEFRRIKALLNATVNRAVDAAKAVMSDEVVRCTDERFGEFWKRLSESLDVRFRNLAEQQAGDIGNVLGDIGKVRKDLGGEISALRSGVDVKASREEVDSLSGAIGLLRGDVASFRESVDGLKSAERAREDSATALNGHVHGLAGTMGTFKGRVKAVEEATDEARRELEALRQVDTGLNVELTRLTTRMRGIEQVLEELKGAFRGIRDEALPDVRRAAIRAEQAATTASAQVAELMPRLEYVEGLAAKMRGLQNFMDRVAALERWRKRHSADIADVAVRVGLNELADELRGALSGEPKDGQ